MDLYHKTDDAGPSFIRLLMDIEHLNLGALECIKGCSNIVGVSKHLCGAATDLAIRCYCTTLPMTRDGKPPTTNVTDDRVVEHDSYPDCKGADLVKRPLHEDTCDKAAVDETSKPGASSCPVTRNGVVMASCCHHRCNWTSYVGQTFFDQLGFGPVDFHLITLMSSWAVCGTRINMDDHSNCK